MKGDFSKKTFDAKKHYKDVNMQQGRVLLDTDWNEQNDINDHRIETETVDTLGAAAAPMHAAGFEIIPVDNAGNPVANATNGTNLKISAGRFYSDGILCENESTVLYSAQPDFLSTALPSQVADAGTYMFYLDVWERHITIFEDDKIREVALNGADTTTRTKTIWQVKYKKVNPPVTCLTDLPPDVPTDAQRGKINAKTEAGTTGGPCGLTTTGGFKGLANQLYRVEIHKAGNRSTATFKWSRENAYIVTSWKAIENATDLRVENPGRDEILGFKPGDWVELIGERTDLLIQPGVLVRLANVEGNIFTIDPSTINDPEGDPANAIARVFAYTNPRIRRWDMKKETGGGVDKGEIRLDKDVWIELEDGVKVEFISGDFLSGDYWLIPARTAEAVIEWPFTTPQLPVGIKHHFSKLAICTLSFAGSTVQWTRISDCRPIFPPLTELISLFYVGGDGQEGRPGTQLSQPLIVGVSNGQWPVQNAKVKFTLPVAGVGSLVPASGIVFTGADGKASCNWILGAEGTAASQTVTSRLLDVADNPKHLPVIFNAKLLPLTMFYVGGDGQEGPPNTELKYPLKVGVAYEDVPANGIKVKFEVTKGNGKLKGVSTTPASIIVTTVNGVAECPLWTLGATVPQEVTATLMDTSATPQPKSNVQIIFSATPVTASGGKKKCSYTVGEEGDFVTLAEAFEKLSEEKNICLCLIKPPRIDENIAGAAPRVGHLIKEVLSVTDKDLIKITGCETTILMDSEFLQFESRKIILHSITLNASLPSAQIILRGRDIDVDYCVFRRSNDHLEVPLVTIDGAQKPTTLNWCSNMIVMGSLALSPLVGGWVRDNQIAGNIILQNGLPFELTWNVNAEQRRLAEAQLLARLVILNPVQLYICGNILNRIVTRVAAENIPGLVLQTNVQLQGYGSLVVSRNIFNNGISSFLGNLVTVTDNHFVRTITNRAIAFALGHKGSFVGNIDASFNADNSAFIDTLFDFGRKIREPNLIRVF